MNEVKDAKVKLKKADEHIAMHAPAATTQEAADEKVQAAPLGVTSAMGTNTKGKKIKQKRAKGQPKERLQEKPQPVETVAAPPEPTTNPHLAATPAGLQDSSQTGASQGSAAQQGASTGRVAAGDSRAAEFAARGPAVAARGADAVDAQSADPATDVARWLRTEGPELRGSLGPFALVGALC